VLGFSQLLYARAAEDMRSRNWLGMHRRMFAFYGGVLKCHLYDPDLNPAYAALGVHFATAIVPARPGHPKDKANASYYLLC
jgi:transposase